MEVNEKTKIQIQPNTEPEAYDSEDFNEKYDTPQVVGWDKEKGVVMRVPVKRNLMGEGVRIILG